MMHARFRRSRARLTIVFALLICVAARGWAQSEPATQTAVAANPADVTVKLDPAQSKISWTLGSTLHTVHGTFNLKRGLLKFDPVNGNASGEFVADATSGQTDNEGRDKKMHREILESARYSEVVFRPDHIDGKLLARGLCSVQLHGIFVLHGAEHELIVPVQAELHGDHWKGTAKFVVPYIQWGLKSPNTWLLKADPTVEVELDLSGSVQGAVAP